MSINLLSRCSLRINCQYNFGLNGVRLTNKIDKRKLSCLCNFGILTSKFGEKWVSEVSRIGYPRRMCSESGPPSNKLPPLMEFPKITWPSLIKSIRNFILATFIIKPYFDRDFNLSDFVLGSKKAVEVVSKKLSEGNIKELDGLVTSDIIPQLQRTVALMSLAQREQIAIEVGDIYFSFPYQVGVIFNDENDQKRFVEITMVFHALRGLATMKSQGEEPPLNMGMLPEYQNRISISNYRFIREFTKGVEGDWTVNLLNHFKPSDDVEEE